MYSLQFVCQGNVAIRSLHGISEKMSSLTEGSEKELSTVNYFLSDLVIAEGKGLVSACLGKHC